MAVKKIYQHHERTTTSSLENDLQLREIGIDAQGKYITAHSETHGAKLRGITEASPAITLQGTLTLSADPVAALQAVTLQYMQTYVTTALSSVSSGVQVKAAVVCATTANITLSGEQTIDGVLTSASRVLVKDQSTGSQNGIYVSAAGAWTRATDLDADSEAPGALTFVSGGTTNGFTQWYVTTAAPITLGTTAITWGLYFSAGAYVGGAGLVKTGLTFDIGTASASRIVVNTNDIDLATTGVGAGTYTKITVDTYGRATAGTTLLDADIPSALTGKTYNGLTLTSAAVGFTIAGGTSARTLTVGGNASVSGTNTGDQTSVTGNAGTATALQNARLINGVSFDGTANITVTAAAGTLTGTTLNSTVVTSSLTSVGTLSSLVVSGNLTNSALPSGRVIYTGTGGLFETGGINFDSANVIISVQNTGTSVGAGATLRLMTSSATGDQAINLMNAGVVTWAFGSDISDSGSFKMSAGASIGSNDKFTLTSAGALTITGAFAASNFSGTHSGTSSGTNTGDQTTVSGNAGSATVLANSRTINGVSFNGSANIVISAFTGGSAIDGSTANKGSAYFGATSSLQVQIDSSVIQAMNNTTPTLLYLNYYGGNTLLNAQGLGSTIVGAGSSPIGQLDVRAQTAGGVSAAFGSIAAGASGKVFISDTTVNYAYGTNSSAEGWINYRGYLNGTTQFRDLRIGDGKENQIAKFVGSTGNLLVGSSGTPSSTLHVEGSVATKYTTTSSNITAGAHHTIEHTGGGVLDFTLPLASSCKGRQYLFITRSTSGGFINPLRSGSDTLNGTVPSGGATYSDALLCVSDGVSNWHLFTLGLA